MSISLEAASSSEQPQCQFFVLRKKRLCRMTVRPGRHYCGEHEPQPIAGHQVDKRIPCPNDPKHTCYASKLEKHLAKCNARQTEDPSYIVRNINAPQDDNPTARVPLKQVPSDTLRHVIDKVNTLYEKHVHDTIWSWQPPTSHHAVVEDSISEASRTDSSRRHLRQASRLMQLAEQVGLVNDSTCYVELGAGKGMLSYYMGVAWCEQPACTSRVLCVDRASLRHKRDNLLRSGTAHRVRADLRHLVLHRAPGADDASALVGVAKHLCGVATDYALRCMCADETLHKSRGVLLATCCHHRCERGPYVGTHKLQELGITSEELNIMCGIVSWATCGDGRSRECKLLDHQPRHRITHGQGDHMVDHASTQHCTNTLTQGDDNVIKEDDYVIKEAVSEDHTNTKKQKLSLDQNEDINKKPRVKRESSQELYGDIIKQIEVDTDTNSIVENVDVEQKTVHTKKMLEDNTKSEENTNIEDEMKVTNENASKEKENTFINDLQTAVTNTQKCEQKVEALEQSFLPLPINIREEVGRRAKSLLDHGRVLYLRDKGFEAKLCYYVPTTESLENVCIVAKKDSS